MSKKVKSAKKKFSNYLITLGVFLLLVTLLFYFKSVEKKRGIVLTNTMDMIDGWYTRVQKNDGDFRYLISVPQGKTLKGNNIVRQAGSLYALAQYYNYRRNVTTKQTLDRGFGYFTKLLEPQGTDASAIVFKGKKQSNASALLLLGLVEYIEANPQENERYKVLAQKLANYLVTTQTEKGSFINMWDPQPKESDYNNGETMYALIRAYKLFKTPQYLASVEKAAAYFESYYDTRYFNSAFYSWGMAGFAHLYIVRPKESYWQFLKDSTDTYWNARGKAAHGYIVTGGKDTPSLAVFLEGTAHTAWLAKEKDEKYYTFLRKHIEESLIYLTRYQPGNPYSSIKTTKPQIQGGICRDIPCSALRIDSTQHYLSAIYLYQTKVK